MCCIITVSTSGEGTHRIIVATDCDNPLPLARISELDALRIQIFNVEATGQYRKLFKLYDVTGATSGTGLEVDTERIDIREVRRTALTTNGIHSVYPIVVVTPQS